MAATGWTKKGSGKATPKDKQSPQWRTFINAKGNSMKTGELARLILDDLDQRRKEGIKKYGTTLSTNNGRMALVDLYQEILDAMLYLLQHIYEEREIYKSDISDELSGYIQDMGKYISEEDVPPEFDTGDMLSTLISLAFTVRAIAGNVEIKDQPKPLVN